MDSKRAKTANTWLLILKIIGYLDISKKPMSATS